MSVSSKLWGKAVEALLACYPKVWRDRFGPQVQADLDEARTELGSPFVLALWMCVSLWDLIRGSIPAHMAAMKEKNAVLSVAGGGSSGQQGPVDYLKAWGFVARGAPSWLFFGGLTILGGALTGVWVYDMVMFLAYGVAGLALLGTVGRFMYGKVQSSILAARQTQDPTEKLAWNLGLVGLVSGVSLFYSLLFNWMSDSSIAAAQQLPHAPTVGVVSMPVAFLVWMVGYALSMTVAGMWSAPTIHPLRHPLRRPLIAPVLLVAGVGGGLAVHVGALNALGAIVLALPFVGLVVGSWKNTRWVNLWGTAAWMLSLPMLLGFLVAMMWDSSKTQTQMAGMLGVNASVPTLLDQAQTHHQTLNQVRAGAPERVFWDYLESAKTSRQEWERAKPWTRLYQPEPLGVSALTWCVALSGRHPQRPVEYCATQPNPDRILERPPHE